MTNTLEAREFQSLLRRLDELLREVGRFADPVAQAHTREIVQALLDVHGAGLEHILGHIDAAGDAGSAVLGKCVADDVAAGLLLLHGLHPLDLNQRVQQALEQVRPLLHSHGGDVELVGILDGVVRLRLRGSCHGCASSAVTMKQTIEDAIIARAPDAVGLEVDGAVEQPTTTPDGRPLVVLSSL